MLDSTQTTKDLLPWVWMQSLEKYITGVEVGKTVKQIDHIADKYNKHN